MAARVHRQILKNQGRLILVALALFVVLLRLPSTEHPFDNDSSANAYHARLIVRGEPLYGLHHPAHHLPAVYYTHALAMVLFGDSLWGVKFFLLWWVVVTTCLLYRLGNLVMGRAAAGVAAVFYAVMTAHLWMWGNSTEIEMFANLPRIAAVWVLLSLVQSYPLKIHPAGAWKFIGVGLLGAVAFLFKAIYFSTLALAALVLVQEWWQTRTLSAGRAVLVRGLWISMGFVAGILPALVYFGALGLLPRLMLVFGLGRAYVQLQFTDLQNALLYPVTGLTYNNIAFLTLGLCGMLLVLLKKEYRTTPVFSIAVWGILAFIEAGAFVRVFRFYYYLLIVPPLALLASWLLFKIYRDLKKQQTHFRIVAPLVLASLLVITFSISAVQNFNFYYHYFRYRLGLETHREFLIEGSPFGPQLVLLQDLADYIKAHTTPADHIFYWSENVQLYYLTDRRPPTDTIWVDYIQSTGPYQRVFTPQTKYFIIDPNRGPFNWDMAELKKNYILETVIYDQQVYRRIKR